MKQEEGIYPMNLQENLQKYADLVVKSGINVQPDQEIIISAPIENAEFARLIEESAYKNGAKEVIMNWTDEESTRLKYQYAPMEVFENIHPWVADIRNYHATRGAGFIYIDGSDPDLLASIDAKKPAAFRKAMYNATQPYHEALDANKNTWCIAAAPTSKWAKKVFPNCNETEAIEKLWTAIFKAVRVDMPDPIGAWAEHKNTFAKKVAYLNEKQFASFHYTNSIGTDITIGLTENHIWIGGGDVTQSEVYYFPNMPTEEIFTTPHKDKVNGTVKSALPLIYQGNVIDNFSITYKDGKVTEYSAEKGYDTLKALIDTDEGAKSLGELALIPNQSPISNMNVLFYNTLFDENASCHFAIGFGFPNCIEGGINMNKEELKSVGVNDSATHVDFMLGTKDLNIVATDKDGNQTEIFKDGNWAF